MNIHRSKPLARLIAILTSTLIAAALSPLASAQGAAVVSAVGPNGVGAVAIVETQARVIAIDVASNCVTLRGPHGRVLDIGVNPEVGDVSKLQIGDVLNVGYQNAILIHADKIKSNGIRERIDETATMPASAGVTASAHRVQVLATIQKLDVKRRLVTLRGPTRTETVEAGPDVPLSGLKVGDSVRAEFVSATAVQVTRSGAPLK